MVKARTDGALDWQAQIADRAQGRANDRDAQLMRALKADRMLS
jgi:hypothetical protein